MDNIDYAGIAALLLAVFTIASAVFTRKDTKQKTDADASLVYEEAATKSAERATKLQVEIEKQDKRIIQLEELVGQLQAENKALREQIELLEQHFYRPKANRNNQ